MPTSCSFTQVLTALVMFVVLASAALAQVPIGPGALPNTNAMVSSQKAGSVLFYLYYESSTLAHTNTRLNITNTHLEESVFVHLFFVASCSPADAYLCLTPNQTLSFTALDQDPDSKGWVMAIAVDGGDTNTPGTGCPINFNWLIGDEFLKVNGGFTANFGAEAVAARFGTHGARMNSCAAHATSVTLNFDGGVSASSYEALAGVLAIDNFPSRLDGHAIRLLFIAPGDSDMMRAGGSVSPNGGGLIGILYDEAEQPYTFFLSGDCSGSNINFNFMTPRILSGGVDGVVGNGRSGWIRIWHGTGKALLGAVLINNSRPSTAFFSSGGHIMHKLTLNTSAVVTIPLFIPAC